MSNAVGNLIVNLIANTGKYTAGLKEAHKETEHFAHSIGHLLHEIEGNFAFKFIETSIHHFAEAELAATKLEAVLHATGESAGYSAHQIEALARSMSRTTLFNHDQIEQAAARLASFRHIQGATFQQALSMSADLASTLDIDIAGAAMKLGKALENPIEGLSGLSRIGVRFTDEQEKMIAKLVESGDLMKAQGVILDELKGKFGGVAEAMGNTTQGAATQLANAWKELQESFGQTVTAVGAPQAMRALARSIRPDNFDMVQGLITPSQSSQDTYDRLISGQLLPPAEVKALRDEIEQIISGLAAKMPSMTRKEWSLAQGAMPHLQAIQGQVEGFLQQMQARGQAAGQTLFGGQFAGPVNRMTQFIGDAAAKLSELAAASGDAAVQFRTLEVVFAQGARLREHQQQMGRGLQGEIAGLLRTPETDMLEAVAKISFAGHHGLIGPEAISRGWQAAQARFAAQAFQPAGQFERGTAAEFSERQRIQAENKSLELTKDQLDIMSRILEILEAGFNDPHKNADEEIQNIHIR